MYVIGSMNTGVGVLTNDGLDSPLMTNVQKTRQPISKKKIRGMHLENCLDIEERHQRDKFKKVNVLINANLEPPMKYKFTYYQFETSCMFDALFELCASAYSNYSCYKIAVYDACKTHSCFMKTIIDYLTNINESVLRLERLRHCLKFYDCVNVTIVSKFTIGKLIQFLFSECLHYIFYIEMKKTQKKEKLNATQLHCYINEYLTKKSNTDRLETYIFVDIQDFSHTHTTNLNDLPERINVNGEFLRRFIVLHLMLLQLHLLKTSITILQHRSILITVSSFIKCNWKMI